jgi:hypothetical protein
MEALSAGEQMQPRRSTCPICRHKVQKKDLIPLEIKLKPISRNIGAS